VRTPGPLLFIIGVTGWLLRKRIVFLLYKTFYMKPGQEKVEIINTDQMAFIGLTEFWLIVIFSIMALSGAALCIIEIIRAIQEKSGCNVKSSSEEI